MFPCKYKNLIEAGESKKRERNINAIKKKTKKRSKEKVKKKLLNKYLVTVTYQEELLFRDKLPKKQQIFEVKLLDSNKS